MDFGVWNTEDGFDPESARLVAISNDSLVQASLCLVRLDGQNRIGEIGRLEPSSNTPTLDRLFNSSSVAKSFGETGFVATVCAHFVFKFWSR